MNWEAIGAIGELVGAVGVIATLGYLAFQIRQNTRQIKQNELATQAAVTNASVLALRDARRSVYENSEVVALWLTGLSDPDELSENDFYRFRLIMQNAIDGIWDVYSQTMTTGLSPETWQTQGIKVIERVVASPGGRLFWAMFSGTYPNDFRAEVDRILDTQSTESWRPPQKSVTPNPASRS